MKKIYYLLLIPAVIFALTSCEKLLTDQAENQISDISEMMQTPQDARDVLNGAYDVLVNGLDGQMQVIHELLSDNVAQPISNDRLIAVYDRTTASFNSTTGGAYGELYLSVFRANLIIKYTRDIPGISESEITQLENEARFVRALAHFWVLKAYAQPWGYTSSNNHLGIVIREEPLATPIPRSTVAECYNFIQNDLVDAFNNLAPNNGAYANKYAAASLLAYTYFLQNDFTNCKLYCDEVINSGMYSLEPTLDTFHAMDSLYQFVPNPEMIFGGYSYEPFNDVRNEDFTNAYRSFSVQGATMSLSEEIYSLITNNPLDNRQEWVKSDQGQFQLLRFGTQETNAMAINFFPIPVLRLTVLHLIRAEACAELGTDLSTAIGDVNAIRERAFGNASLNMPDGSGSAAIIEAARLEFRKETVGEGLWVDQLKRRGARGEIITIRNAPWNCNGMVIQFPQSEGTGVSFVFNPEGGCN